MDGKEKGRKNLYFWCGKKKEGKGREKNCILVQEGNGKDEMSFPSVRMKWEGIDKFFSEKEGKRKEKIGKSVRNFPKTGKKLVTIENFV